MQLSLRDMNNDDWEIGYFLTQQNKWAHRPEDWKLALKFGQGVVAEIDGKPAGCGMIWQWGSDMAIIGHVIVDNNFQGKGVGFKLIERLIEICETKNIRLHATEMGIGLYRKFDFKPYGKIHQHQTRSMGSISVPTSGIGLSIRSGKPGDAETLATIDAHTQGFCRKGFYEHQLTNETVYLLESESGCEGFAVIRKFGHGVVIGPFFAKQQLHAELLFSHCASFHIGEFVRIDTFDSPSFSVWLDNIGVPCIDSPVFMVRGETHKNTGEFNLYGMATQALG